MKSSVTPSRSCLGSDCCALLLVYDGILGIVGDRACTPLMPKALSASVLLSCWGCTLLAGRSFLGTGGLSVTGEALGEVCAGWGAVAVMGVLPCGLLYELSATTKGKRDAGTAVTYSSRLRGTKRSSSLTGGSRVLFSDDLLAAGVGFSLKAVVVVVVVVGLTK